MRLISSLSFSGHLYDKIDAAARAGFDGIEIFREDMVGFDGGPGDVAAIARAAGIRIAALQSLRDVEGLAGEARAAAFRRAARFMDFALALGAPMLVVCANTLPETDPDPGRASADLAELADMAAARGLRLGYEPLAVSRHCRTPLQGWELVGAAGRDNLGLVIGSIHHFAAGDDREALRRIDPARIFLVHLCDASMRRIDIARLRHANRVLPGQGVLPLGGFMAALRGAGYGGPFSIEVFDANERGLPAGVMADDAMRALLLTEAEAEGRNVGAELVGPPDFLHLEAAGRSAEMAAQVIAALGFAETGRSADGRQRLFRQGDLGIVLGKPSGSAAQLCVAGLGLTVPDPERLRRIADPRGDRSEAAGPAHRFNPFGLACLHGPSDIHIYLDRQPLVRGAFARGLQPQGQVPPDPAPVQAIDHVAQAFQMRALLSGLLYWRAALNFQPVARHEVLDPRGAVYSHVLRNSQGQFALNLNAARGESTMTRRFIGQGSAAPIHHVAFACTGLLDLAAGIDRALVLQPPANYHADLMLRFDLPEGLAGRLAAAGLFYDQDAQGSCLQLYTRAIDGVFFELVERRGSYAGFGGGNAAARILAQSRDYEAHWAEHDHP
ncbi:TIM barrel protein [Paracoccus sp. (in: a-proteobacteria)]|uniref:sugar phosphate isomerase/epimerase and 4-hydroxyphenylpyruvate domain-containing protein n=1 Tax=Paracoccus sp. TaxID=267 RepID=UPI00321F7CD2